MECAPSSSSTSSTYEDLLHTCTAAGVRFSLRNWRCGGIACDICPIDTPFDLTTNCLVTHRAILAYYNAGLIDISEYLI